MLHRASSLNLDSSASLGDDAKQALRGVRRSTAFTRQDLISGIFFAM